MTRPTQPRHAIQHLLGMPRALQHACMRRLGDQVVVRQRDPIPTAQLAGLGACAGPDGRGRRDGINVRGEERGEEVVVVCLVRGWREEGVRFQAVDGDGRHARQQVGACCGGERGRVRFFEPRGGCEEGVGERTEGSGQAGEDEGAEVLFGCKFVSLRRWEGD